MTKYPVWWQLLVTYFTGETKSYRYKDVDPYRAIGWLYSTSMVKIERIDYCKWETVEPECPTIDLPQTITLPVKVSAQLREELTKYCYERCMEEF